MAKLNYSRQREAIKDFLMTRKDHPTADTIYQNIREEFPNISLGTVYRNLSLLNDLGEIMKVITNDGKDHFDGNAVPHDHFICNNCNSVLDLKKNVSDDLDHLAANEFDGIIKGHSTIFYGYCPECKKTLN